MYKELEEEYGVDEEDLAGLEEAEESPVVEE
jgi:hypothetical protein